MHSVEHRDVYIDWPAEYPQSSQLLRPEAHFSARTLDERSALLIVQRVPSAGDGSADFVSWIGLRGANLSLLERFQNSKEREDEEAQS
jgi:hypothetical protein